MTASWLTRLLVVAGAATALAAVVSVGAVVAQQQRDCYAGLVVASGERCTYPGTSVEFWVDDPGRGHFLFFTSGTGIDARNTTINGVTYDFKASIQPDGFWIIEAVGTTTTTTTPPPTTATGAGSVVRVDVSDVAGGVHKAAIDALNAQGVFAGTGCTEGFCPGRPLDRATMAVWTVRVLDGEDPRPVASTRFADVDAAHPYAEFIERFAELGVTDGCGDGTRYCPDGTVFRSHMAVFLSHAFDLPDAPAADFLDVEPHAWYAPEVARLAASRITGGCGDGTRFCPGRPTTRAEMATFLNRATRLAKTTTPDTEQEHTGRVRARWDGSTVVVSWDAVPGATHYAVYYDDFFDDLCDVRSGRARFCDVLTSSVTGTRFVHTSPDRDRNYYWVVACDQSGCSAIDSKNPATPTGTRISSPQVRIVSTSSTSLTLRVWLPNSGSDGHRGLQYELRRSTRKGSGYITIEPTVVEIPNAIGVTYIDSGVQPGTTYYYVVRACRDTTCFDPSEVAGITEVDGQAVIPDAPTGLHGEKVDIRFRSDDARIWWSPVDGATHYEVYEGGIDGLFRDIVHTVTGRLFGDYTLDATVFAPKTTYYDGDPNKVLFAFETTYYRVRACNKAGCSELSESVRIS